MFMKTIKSRMLLVCVVGLMSALQLSAQHRARPIIMAVSTDITELAFGQLNGQFQFNPVSFIGLCARTSVRVAQEQQGDFNEQSKGFLGAGELRIYPFGAPRQYHAKHLMERGFRGFSNYDDNWMQIYLRGLYVGIGAEYRRTEMSYLPAAQLTSPWPSFDYIVREFGGTLQLGYGISISHFYLGAGYRLRFSRPGWEGPVDIFGDELLTQTYPISFRRRSSLQVEVGMAF
jgi:hypothetical protein